MIVRRRASAVVLVRAVLRNPRCVKDSLQRRHLLHGCIDESGDGKGVTDVDSFLLDLGASSAPCVEPAFGMPTASAAPANDDEVPRALCHKPIDHGEANPAKGAGDQIGGLSADGDAGIAGRTGGMPSSVTTTRPCWVPRDPHPEPGVVGRRRTRWLGGWGGAVVYACDDLRGEPYGEFAPEREHPIDVECNVLQVVVERSEFNGPVAVDIGLADVYDSPEFCCRLQVLPQCFARKRGIDDIRTAPVREPHDVVDEVHRAGVDGVVSARGPCELSPCLGACAGDHPVPEVACDLDLLPRHRRRQRHRGSNGLSSRSLAACNSP